MTTMAGRIVCGRYKIKSQLGQGGMGIVYKADDSVDGRHVALKQLRPKVSPHILLKNLFASHKSALNRLTQSESPGDSTALGREYLHMAALAHPNLIEVYNYETESDGAAYLVMELLEGRSLQQVLDVGRAQKTSRPRTRTAVPLATVIDYGIQILRGLVFLHSRGYVHCDLKPANLFVLSSDGRIKILDYGLMHEQTSPTEHSLGTPAFAAPEQLSEGKISVKSDLYSVGVVLLELCGGLDSKALTTEQSIAGYTEQAAAAFRSDLPIQFQRWLLRLLRRDPALRWSSAEEALAALIELSGAQAEYETPASTQSYVLSARLLGRDAELSRLKFLFDDLHPGQGRAVLVAGASGIGKSRLAAEFGKYVKISGGKFTVGRYHDNVNDRFSALRDILQSLLPAAPPELINKYRNELAAVCPEVANECDQEPHDIYDETGSLEQFYHLIVAFLLEFSASIRQSLVLVFEDLHFQPEFTLFNVVREKVRGHSLLVIGTLRDDETDPRILASWEGDTIRLHPFPRVVLQSMAADIFAGAVPHEVLLNGIEQVTSGNPFFIEQFLLELARRGVIRKHRLKWEVGEYRPGELSMPAVESLLERRVSGLSENEIRFMRLLSACSGNTPTRHIARLFDEADAIDLQTSLLNKHLITLTQHDFLPCHHYIRQYFYRCDSDRESLHQTLAELFEQHVPDDLVLIAYHYARSSRRDKQLQYLEPAAERARRNNNYPQALEFYSKLVEALRPLAGVSAQVVNSLFNIVMLSDSLGTSGEAEADIRQVLRCVGPKTDPTLSARLHLALGTIQRHQSDHNAALATLELAAAYSDEAGDTALLARCRFAVASLLGNLGRLPEALQHCEQALELYESMHATPPGNLLSYMGGVYQYVGDAATSRAFQVKCLEISEKQGDKHTMATALYYLAEICSMKLEHSRALEYYHRALELSRMLGNRKDTAQILHGIGLTHWSSNNYSPALEFLLQSLAESRFVRDDDFIAITLSQLARIYTTLGEYDRASEMLQEQRLLAGEGNSAYIAVMNCLAQSFWHAKQGEYANAETCLLDHREQAAALGDHMLVNILFDLTKLYFVMSQPAKAVDHCRQTLALYEKMGQVHSVAQLNLLMAENLLREEQYAEARLCVNKALDQAAAQNQEVYRTQGLMLAALLDYHALSSALTECEARARTTQTLEQLADCTNDDITRAEIYYRLWKLHSDAHPRVQQAQESTEKFRRLALRWLQAIADGAPSFDRQRRIRLLEAGADDVPAHSDANAATAKDQTEISSEL